MDRNLGVVALGIIKKQILLKFKYLRINLTGKSNFL